MTNRLKDWKMVGGPDSRGKHAPSILLPWFVLDHETSFSRRQFGYTVFF
jgi:hypothetical protein